MALWMVRSDKDGRHESRILEEGLTSLAWWEIDKAPLPMAPDNLDAYREYYREAFPNAGKNTVSNYASQLRAFAVRIKKGDWVAMPSKMSSTIHFGKVIGDYEFASKADALHHRRKVDWFGKDIPRDRFDPDILHSFGAFITVARIQRNDAEERIKAMEKNGWAAPSRPGSASTAAPVPELAAQDLDEETLGGEALNLAAMAEDEISKHVIRKYQGAGLEGLVQAVLEAEGYHVRGGVGGSDGGVDLLAAPGDLGFGDPKIAVEVKSGDSPVGQDVMRRLQGVMGTLNCDYGILVSWSGFKSSLLGREANADFFRVRLWDRNELLKRVFRNYDKLPADIRADLPLQQIWILRPETD